MNEEMKPAIVMPDEYTKAVEANALVDAGFEIMGNGLYQMCIGIKRMHDDKLYKHFDFQNFEDYCRSKGFTPQYGRQLIRIAEMAESENGNSSFHFEKLGVKKNLVLSMFTPEERQEFIETHDVENMSVRELQAAKAENERLKKERDEAQTALASKDKQFREALEGKDKQLKAVKESGEQSLSECKAYLNGRIHDLEKRIHDMENAPIDHDMTDADAAEEIKRLKRQLEDEQLRFTVLEGDAAAKARRAAEEVRQEYEKKIAEMQSAQPAEQETPADTKAVFKAYLANAADSMSRLLTYLESIRDDKNLPLYVSKVDGIVEMTQSRRNAL